MEQDDEVTLVAVIMDIYWPNSLLLRMNYIEKKFQQKLFKIVKPKIASYRRNPSVLPISIRAVISPFLELVKMFSKSKAIYDFPD